MMAIATSLGKSSRWSRSRSQETEKSAHWLQKHEKKMHLYSPSCSLHSLSDTHHMLKNASTAKPWHGFGPFSHFGPYIWNSLPQDIRHSLCHPVFLQKQIQDFSLLWIFQLGNTPSPISVCTMCVRVCVYVCVCVFMHLAHSYAWTLVEVYIMC